MLDVGVVVEIPLLDEIAVMVLEVSMMLEVVGAEVMPVVDVLDVG